jgi:VWFA-related protein
MCNRYGGWICLFCLSLFAGFAQQNRPVNRSITLDVAVTDKSGKPVPGLQRSDFTLLDNKQRQKIVSFRAVDSAPASADPSVEVILVIDEVNTPFLGVATVRDQIEKFLGQNGGALALPVSVVLISDSGTAVRTAPSRDGNALIANLNNSEFGLRTIRKHEQLFAASDQQRLSVQALAQLPAYEAPKPGRKLMVWISPGWPLFLGSSGNLTSKDQEEIFDTVVSISDALRRAGITLYNVDPIGAAEGEMHMSDFEQFFKGVKKAGQVSLGNLGLQAFAYQSGGRILNASNDITGEIATCVTDGTAFYVLTFNGLPGDGPNEYHELNLKIDKPKLTVRALSGYYAQP